MKKIMAFLLCVVLLGCLSAPVYAVPEEEDYTIEISASAELQSDNTVAVTLYDDRGGVVSHWPVSLEIDGEVVERNDTDETGIITFDHVVSQDEQVRVIADDGAYDVYTFIGCSVDLNGGVSDATDSETDSTTSADEPDQEQNISDTADATTTDTENADTTTTTVDAAQSTTDTLVLAPMTTTVRDNLIGVGVDVDNGVADAMQIPAAQLVASSRLWMDKDQYQSLVSNPDAMLHLQLTQNTEAVTPAVLIAAKNADPAYASYDDSEVKGFAVNMHLMYVDNENFRVDLEPAGGLYTLEMPVPQSLYRCEKIAVAVCTADGLDSFIELKPSNGVVKFSVKRFQTLAFVGFGDAGAVGSMAQTPWMLIVIGTLGLALVVGGVVLLITVTFRRRKAMITALSEEDDRVQEAVLPPSDDLFVEDEEDDGEEYLSAVMVDLGEQAAVGKEQREQFRIKPNLDQATFDRIPEQSVSPAKQIIADQQHAAQASDVVLLGDDELNDMLDAMIDDLSSEGY